jgi:hypothetical protein
MATNDRNFVLLRSHTMSPCGLERSFAADFRRKWICGECHTLKPDPGPLDVQIENRNPKGSMNFLFGEGLDLARMSLLSQLGVRRIKRDLFLGKVTGPDGRELKDWVTYRGKRRLIVRGSIVATNRKCKQCGQHIYTGRGVLYLYPAPPKDAVIFGTRLGLILPEKLWLSLNIGRARGFRVVKLPVLDEPLDGLPPLYP